MNGKTNGYWYAARRKSSSVRIGGVVIGGDNPPAVQSMTDTDTLDTEACAEQIGRMYRAGCRIVRLTAQGTAQARNLENIASLVRASCPGTVLAADIHFVPEAAFEAALHADKVRINPGNFPDDGDTFRRLLEVCRSRGTALRIGVNHGSLSRRITDRWGDTPRGMVESAMEYLRVCRSEGFANTVVSMKSSNTRVMVAAYRMLADAMEAEGMDYPLHLGVTEAGAGTEGRVKSAVGIGALLTDGLGDTLRVSLTEPPENEIAPAQLLVRHFSDIFSPDATAAQPAPGFPLCFDPCRYARRESDPAGRVGGGAPPALWSELDADELAAAAEGRIAVLESADRHPAHGWRRVVSEMNARGDRRPVMLYRDYTGTPPGELAVIAAADLGVMFLDGLADGLRIECEGMPRAELDRLSLDILQAARARVWKTEYIACPGCGRTLYDLQGTLARVRERTSHLPGLKIAVMGCIVNGPGEMADADYGYVGAGRGRITLYRGAEPVLKNIPESGALDRLEELLRADGRWREPDAK